MYELDQQYKDKLDQIADHMQQSEVLEAYLDTEEYGEYKGLIDTYEPYLQDLYEIVANEHPLQLVALEKAMLRHDLEGLYLPKIVGYTVLRGEVDSNYKYRRPQAHFKSVLDFIAHSSNFEMIKLRVGQSIQVGFALSSDIWITNFIDSVANSKVKSFLLSQKLSKYRTLDGRKSGLEKYRKQFESLNYYTAKFPETVPQLMASFHRLRTFLLHRGKGNFDNTSFNSAINDFITNKELIETAEYVRILIILGLFFDLDDVGQKGFADAFAKMVKKHENLTEDYFEIIDIMQSADDIHITPEADKRLSELINGKATQDINKYYELMNVIHTKGFVHEDTIEAVQKYYYSHEGLSTENKCLRACILNYCAQVMNNLPVESYQDYFELNKTFVQYINIFSNQHFNQALKDICLAYIKRLLKNFTDKRGRDYQDIKKFVTTTFLDLGFMKEKELVDLFKTRRKKKKAE